MRLADRVVVITGGAQGIGRASALRFAAEGAQVVIADKAVDFALEVVEEIRRAGGAAQAHPLDVTDASAVGRFFHEFGQARGRIDVLVNCPARVSDTHFERVTESEFDLDLAVTLKAPFLCIQAALPYLLRSARPAVVNIGSVNGAGAFGNEVYSAAKAGLENLTKNLAVRYGPVGLRLNVVAPGTVRTHNWEARTAADADVLDNVARLYPLRRVGVPDDVAGACVFLASDEASWITGAVLPVDGGITAGHSDLIGTVFGPGYFGTTVDLRPNA